ncbi:methyltransferase domain-containing protein [Candidatus Uhrbacteria bacterium]|nr:methyltransferase domain-containing protein [Candidatus Uhrbacteria bacterium]
MYAYLHTFSNTEIPHTLDLGCGTGISTRELKENGFDVIGVDRDGAMVERAQQRSPEINYSVAVADTLPFPEDEFDIVVAFTAFHWFNNQKSLAEISRVLKRGGIFFAALKSNRESAFMEGYTAILKKYAGQDFDSTTEHFKTGVFKSIFTEVKENFFTIDERYTIEEALILVRSLSLWNLVSEENRPQLIERLREYFQQNLIGGFVVRERKIFTLSGVKK